MTRLIVPVLTSVLTLAIGLGFPQAGHAQDAQATAAAAAPEQALVPIPDARSSLGIGDPAAVAPDALQGSAQAPQGAAPQLPRLMVVVPARPLAAYSVSVGVAVGPGPYRAYRRPPIPAYAGIYVAPRYVYPGYIAPWGSLPPRYLAASIPIPLRIVQPAGYLERPEAAASRAYRPVDPVPEGSSSRIAPDVRMSTPAPPIPRPPEPGPEAIPAPVPIEAQMSGSSDQPGTGTKAKAPTVSAEKPAVRAAPTLAPPAGPREF
jgi:hypothetical protein